MIEAVERPSDFRLDVCDGLKGSLYSSLTWRPSSPRTATTCTSLSDHDAPRVPMPI